MRSCCLPPSNRWMGCLKYFPLRSHSAISTALMAQMVTPVRPKYIVRRYISCQRRSVSSGFSPINISRRPHAMLWLNGASRIALTTSGDASASPMPSSPSSVRTRISTTSWQLAVFFATDLTRRIWQMIWEIFMERSFVLECLKSFSEDENEKEDEGGSLYPPLTYENRNPSLQHSIAPFFMPQTPHATWRCSSAPPCPDFPSLPFPARRTPCNSHPPKSSRCVCNRDRACTIRRLRDMSWPERTRFWARSFST